jgi:hypothetical protein
MITNRRGSSASRIITGRVSGSRKRVPTSLRTWRKLRYRRQASLSEHGRGRMPARKCAYPRILTMVRGWWSQSRASPSPIWRLGEQCEGSVRDPIRLAAPAQTNQVGWPSAWESMPRLDHALPYRSFSTWRGETNRVSRPRRGSVAACRARS